MRRISLVVMLGVVAACAHARSAAPVSPPPVKVDPAAEENAANLALLDERDALGDWRGTFYQKAQTPPKGFRGIPKQAPFPLAKITSARAFTFGQTATLHCPSPSDVLMTRGGTFCDDVVAPGVVLADAERAAVLDLLRPYATGQKRGPRVALQCDFDPHHAIVFYDAHEVPIANLEVCFTCGEWEPRPNIDAIGGDHVPMDPSTTELLRSVFDGAHLAAWAFGDNAIGDRVRAWNHRVFYDESRPNAAMTKRIVARTAQPSGVAPDRPIARLTAPERDRLCVWFVEAMAGGHQGLGHGFECEGGRTWATTESRESCAAARPKCSATTGQIERCMANFVRPPGDLCAGPIPGCEDVLDCLPGVGWRGSRDANVSNR